MPLPSRSSLVIVLSVLALAACSDDATTLGPGGVDASPSVDASTAVDASTGVDAARPLDASTPPSPDASTPHDAGATPDAQGSPDAANTDAGAHDASADGGLLPFGSPCTQNPECQSDLCFDFNAKGMHCTQKCQTANDCPGGAGGLGCSGMGVCKVP